MYKVILFDFFGVIQVDQYQSWLKSHHYERSGRFASVSRLADMGRISMKEFFGSLSKFSHLPTQEIQTEFTKTSKLNNGIIDLIRSLRHDGYKIGMISNSSAVHLRNILRSNNLEPLFDEIIVSAEVGLIKPSHEIFEYALQKNNCEVTETIFIDDNINNVKAAEEIGIKSLLFTDNKKLIIDLKTIGVIKEY